jgi:hypothetical protein
LRKAGAFEEGDMAHPSFEVGKFKVLGRYEVHFGRDPRGFWFYEIQDRETLALVDVKDGLTEGEFLGAIGCALDPFQLLEFQELIHSLT